MEENNKIAIQLVGWFIIAMLVFIFGMVYELVQSLDVPLSVAAFLLALIGFSAELLRRLIKLYFGLEGESPLENQT